MELFSIRSARQEDRSTIVDLWHAGWHEAHANLVPEGILEFRTVDCFWDWLGSSTDRFHVAVDGDVVGFVATNGPEIVKLYVAGNVRGTGVATALLSYGEEQISHDGILDAVLFCTAGNTRAQSFYAREGWTLSRTFADQLWLPKGTTGDFIVDTHRYEKRLNK